MTARPPDCDVLVSNCPYGRAMQFVEHALALRFRVLVFLLPPSFLFTADRYERLHKRGHLRRVHVLAERLQGMHDAAHIAAGGKEASQSQIHAWFVFDRDYCGPATISPVSINAPGARMPWADHPSRRSDNGYHRCRAAPRARMSWRDCGATAGKTWPSWSKPAPCPRAARSGTCKQATYRSPTTEADHARPDGTAAADQAQSG